MASTMVSPVAEGVPKAAIGFSRPWGAGPGWSRIARDGRFRATAEAGSSNGTISARLKPLISRKRARLRPRIKPQNDHPANQPRHYPKLKA